MWTVKFLFPVLRSSSYGVHYHTVIIIEWVGALENDLGASISHSFPLVQYRTYSIGFQAFTEEEQSTLLRFSVSLGRNRQHCITVEKKRA